MLTRQTSPFLSDVLKDVARGDLIPAPMQRPYVWSAEDVEAFCASVQRGFPIGSFLCWMPQDLDMSMAPLNRLGPIKGEMGQGGQPRGMILDGGNRHHFEVTHRCLSP